MRILRHKVFEIECDVVKHSIENIFARWRAGESFAISTKKIRFEKGGYEFYSLTFVETYKEYVRTYLSKYFWSRCRTLPENAALTNPACQRKNGKLPSKLGRTLNPREHLLGHNIS